MNDSKAPAILLIVAILVLPGLFVAKPNAKPQPEPEPIEQLDEVAKAAQAAVKAWLREMAANCDEFAARDFATLDDQYNALADENEADRAKAFEPVNRFFDAEPTVEARRKLFPKAAAGYRAAADSIAEGK